MTATATGVLLLAACGSDVADFRPALSFPELAPGDLIALRTTDVPGEIEYISRRSGEILSASIDDGSDPALIATIDVGTEGAQRGLLGHTILDGQRFAAWTQPDTLQLVVGEVTSGTVDRIVWEGTATESKAVGGSLGVLDGRLLLGLGSLTAWARAHGSGALVLLDPDGQPSQQPVVQSDGWNNPWAFTVLADGTVWVADNAPDGSDRPVAERDGEWIVDSQRRFAAFVDPPPQRGHSAILELPDGRLGVCGFVDDEMLAYARVSDDVDGARLERAGTIGRCLTSATVLADETIVVATVDDAGVPILETRSMP